MQLQVRTRIDGGVDLDAQQLVGGDGIACHHHTGNNALCDAEGVPTNGEASHQDGILQQRYWHSLLGAAMLTARSAHRAADARSGAGPLM